MSLALVVERGKGKPSTTPDWLCNRAIAARPTLTSGVGKSKLKAARGRSKVHLHGNLQERLSPALYAIVQPYLYKSVDGYDLLDWSKLHKEKEAFLDAALDDDADESTRTLHSECIDILCDAWTATDLADHVQGDWHHLWPIAVGGSECDGRNMKKVSVTDHVKLHAALCIVFGFLAHLGLNYSLAITTNTKKLSPEFVAGIMSNEAMVDEVATAMMNARKDHSKTMMGRRAPIPEALTEEEANRLMAKRRRSRDRDRVKKQNLRDGIDPATTRKLPGRKIQSTEGLSYEHKRKREVGRISSQNNRNKKKGKALIVVDDSQVPKMPGKHDKTFLAHIGNVKGYMERHGGSYPVSWNLDYAVPQDPSPDVLAQVSYAKLFSNVGKKSKKLHPTWRVDLLAQVGITRDSTGKFHRHFSTYGFQS